MRASPHRIMSIWLPRVAILIAVAIGLFFLAGWGIRFRHWVWDTTVPIRFVEDINRGYDWGRKGAIEGYVNQYEKMQVQQPTDRNWLDYAPLRMAVMTLWGKWSLTHFPNVESWQNDHSFALTAPVLRFNLAMEFVGLLSAFFLTRLWAIRRHPMVASDSLTYFFRGCIPGLVAVLLLWFNPAIVLSAYGWPTWDLWIIPMFLLAALLASLDWWFAAGIVLGVGTMFKGQQLVAVPVFAIWALVAGRPVAVLRLCAGLILTVAVIVSPWLLTYLPADKLANARAAQALSGQAYRVAVGTFQIARVVDVPALIWVVCTVLAAGGLPWVGWLTLEKKETESRWRRMLQSRWAWRVIAAFGVVTLVYWPWLLKRNRADWPVGFFAVTFLMIAVLLVRPRGIKFLVGSTAGVALLFCMLVFHGSTSWFDCGIYFGTIHKQRMTMGMTDNLPAILSDDFGWDQENINVTAITISAKQFGVYPKEDLPLSIKQVLLIPFVTTLLLSSIGVGLHGRRRDSRILIALTATWLMFFCFPAEMHARYLLYGAAISCICAGVSTGMTLLGIFLSLVTTLMTFHLMLSQASVRGGVNQYGKILHQQFPSLLGDDAGAKLLSLANGMHPDLGYAVILVTLIFLYFSLALRRTNPDLRSTSDAGLVT